MNYLELGINIRNDYRQSINIIRYNKVFQIYLYNKNTRQIDLFLS